MMFQIQLILLLGEQTSLATNGIRKESYSNIKSYILKQGNANNKDTLVRLMLPNKSCSVIIMTGMKLQYIMKSSNAK